MWSDTWAAFYPENAMPNALFPVFLDLAGRRCLLIGGERCAVEKGNALLASGAHVTVVAPRLATPLQEQMQAGRLRWLAEHFREEHMERVWFVVSTLSDEAKNRRIHAEANRRRLFLNVVDQPAFCTFHWPASLHRPPVNVAFSTGGTSPALAGYLRRKMETLLPEHITELAHWLAAWRTTIAPLLPDLTARGRLWRTLFDQGVAERFLSGDKTGADTMIHDALYRLDGSQGRMRDNERP